MQYWCQYFFLTIMIRHVSKDRDPSFSISQYHTWVSKRSVTLVLLECLCMDFCREYISTNLSFLDGEICVINLLHFTNFYER